MVTSLLSVSFLSFCLSLSLLCVCAPVYKWISLCTCRSHWLILGVFFYCSLLLIIEAGSLTWSLPVQLDCVASETPERLQVLDTMHNHLPGLWVTELESSPWSDFFLNRLIFKYVSWFLIMYTSKLCTRIFLVWVCWFLACLYYGQKLYSINTVSMHWNSLGSASYFKTQSGVVRVLYVVGRKEELSSTGILDQV